MQHEPSCPSTVSWVPCLGAHRSPSCRGHLLSTPTVPQVTQLMIKKCLVPLQRDLKAIKLNTHSSWHSQNNLTVDLSPASTTVLDMAPGQGCISSVQTYRPQQYVMPSCFMKPFTQPGTSHGAALQNSIIRAIHK